MQVVRFDPDKHLEMVEGWCKQHDMPGFPKGWLPTYGACVDGVACAWLYVTDSDLAIIENVITNPDTTHEKRVEAVGLITEEIARVARENCKCKWLVGASKYESILRGAIEHGFVVTEQVHQIIRKL